MNGNQSATRKSKPRSTRKGSGLSQCQRYEQEPSVQRMRPFKSMSFEREIANINSVQDIEHADDQIEFTLPKPKQYPLFYKSFNSRRSRSFLVENKQTRSHSPSFKGKVQVAYRKKCSKVTDASTQTTADVGTQTNDEELSLSATGIIGSPNRNSNEDSNDSFELSKPSVNTLLKKLDSPINGMISSETMMNTVTKPTLSTMSSLSGISGNFTHLSTGNDNSNAAEDDWKSFTKVTFHPSTSQLKKIRSAHLFAGLNDLEEEIALMRYKVLSLNESIEWLEREKRPRPNRPVIKSPEIQCSQIASLDSEDIMEFSSSSSSSLALASASSCSSTSSSFSSEVTMPVRLPSSSLSMTQISSQDKKLSMETETTTNTTTNATRNPAPTVEFTNSQPLALISRPSKVTFKETQRPNQFSKVVEFSSSPNSAFKLRLGKRMSKSLPELPELKSIDLKCYRRTVQQYEETIEEEKKQLPTQTQQEQK